jgi:hypothetical protein
MVDHFLDRGRARVECRYRRLSNVVVIPVATSPIVFTEHGAISIPAVWKDPDEMVAPISSILCETLASASISTGLRPVSCASVMRAARLITR